MILQDLLSCVGCSSGLRSLVDCLHVLAGSKVARLTEVGQVFLLHVALRVRKVGLPGACTGQGARFLPIEREDEDARIRRTTNAIAALQCEPIPRSNLRSRPDLRKYLMIDLILEASECQILRGCT